MKNSYPGYSYENLFTLGYLSREKDYYTDFDPELDDFAEALPYTANDKNPFDEESYGDKEQLAVKALLKNYRALFPEKSYLQLYETYVKDIYENSVLTQEEKRSRYMWKMIQAENELEKLTEQKKDAGMLAIAGCVVIVSGVIAMIIIKRKA